MKYKVRQKIFSFGDNFVIKDEFDRDRYVVRGKIFTLGDKLKIEDMNGRELIYIEQKIFRLLPEYNIYSLGNHIAWIKKEFTLFSHKININSIYGDYKILGNFWGYNFQIVKNGKTVAAVSKKLLSFSDTYIADVSDDEDQAFILALVIVIDQIVHDNNHNNS